MRPCKICGQEKPLSDEFYYRQSSGGRFSTSRCRQCRIQLCREQRNDPKVVERRRLWRLRNKSRQKDYQKNLEDKNPTYWRDWKRKNRKRRLLRVYGLSEAQFEALYDKHGGRCHLCRKIPKGTLAVDHDHETGRVRGLLCSNCNRGLGYLHDDSELLKRALVYLEQTSVPNLGNVIELQARRKSG